MTHLARARGAALTQAADLFERVFDPAVRRAGETLLANLDAIMVEQMCETADKAHVLDDEKVSGDFRYLMAGPSRTKRAAEAALPSIS